MSRKKRESNIEANEEVSEGKSAVNDDELKEWGKEKYPDFVMNLELMRKCWEKEKGINDSVREYLKKDVKGVKEGESVELEVLVARKKNERNYRGCSSLGCRRKKNPNIADEHYVCVCGHKGIIEYTWHKYFCGDKTGNIVVQTNQPSEEVSLLEEGKLMKVRGFVRVDKFDGGLLCLSLDSVVNDGKTKSNEKIEKVCSDVADTINLYRADGGMEEVALKKWIEKQKFGVSYKAILDSLDIEEEDGKLFVADD